MTPSSSSLGLAAGDGLLVQHWDDEVVLGHEAVLGDKDREPPAEAGLSLELVKDLSVVEIGMGEDAVDATAN